MIDLIGFWGAATLIAVPQLFLGFWLLLVIVYFSVYQITQDSAIAIKVSDKLYRRGGLDSGNPFYERTFLSKFAVETRYLEAFSWASMFVLIIFWILALADYQNPKIGDGTVLSLVSGICTWAAPTLGWIFTATLVYSLSIWALRKMYRFSLFVHKMKDKLDGHIADKQVHK